MGVETLTLEGPEGLACPSISIVVYPCSSFGTAEPVPQPLRRPSSVPPSLRSRAASCDSRDAAYSGLSFANLRARGRADRRLNAGPQPKRRWKAPCASWLGTAREVCLMQGVRNPFLQCKLAQRLPTTYPAPARGGRPGARWSSWHSKQMADSHDDSP